MKVKKYLQLGKGMVIGALVTKNTTIEKVYLNPYVFEVLRAGLRTTPVIKKLKINLHKQNVFVTLRHFFSLIFKSISTKISKGLIF